MKKLSLALFILFLSLFPSFSQTIDSCFTVPLVIRPAKVMCMKMQPDGKLLLGGDISLLNSVRVNNLVRLNTDNSVDETFSFNGINELLIMNIEIQSSGDLIVFARKYSKDVFDVGFFIFRLGPDGRIKNEIDTLNYINSITMQNDDKVIVGGGHSQGGYLYRLNTDLSNDEDFNNNSFNNTVTSVGCFGNYIYAGGHFSEVNGSTKRSIARFKSDGSIDNTFDTGSGTSDLIGSLSFQTDGKIFIGRTFINQFNGKPYQGLIRLNTDGSVDSGFTPPNFFGPTSDIVVSGSSVFLAVSYIHNSSNSYLIKLKSDGTIVSDFSPILLDKFGFSDFCMLINSSNIIFNNLTTKANIYGLSATDSNGTPITDFKPETGRFGTLVQTDYFNGKLIVAGDFVKINDVITYGIALLDKNGEVDTSYILRNNLGRVKQVKILSDNALLINTQSNFFKLNNKAEIDSGFNFSPFKRLYEILKFIVRRDGKIFVTNGNNVYLLHSNGTEDPSFITGTGMDGTYASLFDFDIQENKILYGSIFNTFNGISVNKLVRLNQDGSIDNSFNIGSGPDNDVSLVKVLKSGEMIIGGFFNHFNGFQIPYGIVKLSENGAVDQEFLINQKKSWFEHNIDVVGSKVELADSIVYVKGDMYIAKFHINGTIYNDFTLPGEVNTVNDIITVNDTTIVGGGKKSQVDNLIESYMYALGSFRRTGSSDPFTIMKLYLGGVSSSILNVSHKTINLTAEAGSNSSIQIVSNEIWTITCDQTWLNFSPESGNGNTTLNIISLFNNSGKQRSAVITVTGKDGKKQTITVTQENSTTGINDIPETYVSVYPMPVKDKLHIIIQDNIPGSKFSVISSTGQSLYSSKIAGNITEVDMSSYSQGLYFIRIIRNDHKVILKKILKE